MQIGGCPYDDCAEFAIYDYEGETPRFCKTACDNCGRTFWLYLSRIDPCAYTEAGFHERFVIDEEAKTIRERATH